MKAKILEMDVAGAHRFERDGIAIPNDFDARNVLRLAVENSAQHIVQKNCREFDQEILVSETMIFRPDEFLNDPVAVILNHQQDSEFRFEASAQQHKGQALEQLEAYVQTLHGSRSIIGEVIASTEELYTNASKNTGNFYKRLKNVNTGKVREGSVAIWAGATQDTLVVGCVDSFGLLDIPSLLTKVLACYDKVVANSISREAGGAGIGTFLVYNFAMNIYIAVEKGKKTAVFCSYPLGMRTRDFEFLPKNLPFISI